MMDSLLGVDGFATSVPRLGLGVALVTVGIRGGRLAYSIARKIYFGDLDSIE
jgi:hypothetical protein